MLVQEKIFKRTIGHVYLPYILQVSQDSPDVFGSDANGDVTEKRRIYAEGQGFQFDMQGFEMEIFDHADYRSAAFAGAVAEKIDPFLGIFWAFSAAKGGRKNS